MVDTNEARSALTAYRKSLGLTLRRAASQIGCTHAALISWESGKQNPTENYRRLIQRWSKGRIKAKSWPVSRRERVELDRIERKLSEAAAANDRAKSGKRAANG